METKELAQELDAIVDGIQGVQVEHRARVARAEALIKEFQAFCGDDHFVADPERLASRSRDYDARPEWMRDARAKAYDAIERWCVAHGLRAPVR